MPELPEVEVIRSSLANVLIGKEIAQVKVLEKRSFVDFDSATAELLAGAVVDKVERRGKLLMLGLSVNSITSDRILLIHLRMTGQLIYRATGEDDPAFAGGYPSASLVGELPGKTTRVIIDFSDRSRLFFNDQRKFGYLKLVDQDALAREDFLVRLGPEPLDDSFTWQRLRESLGARSTTSIKAALLDQNRIAGIGNIYADESLFRARIDPRRSVASLNAADYKRLLAGIRECLIQSIDDGGSTWRNYVDAVGLRGEFLDLHATVYGRASKPCPKCKTPITKIRLAGRGTHLCEKCQR